MPLPMMGAVTATVNDFRPFAIHGDRYFEFHVTLEPDRSDMVIRVAEHTVKASPKVGARVQIKVLLGQVTEVSDV